MLHFRPHTANDVHAFQATPGQDKKDLSGNSSSHTPDALAGRSTSGSTEHNDTRDLFDDDSNDMLPAPTAGASALHSGGIEELQELDGQQLEDESSEEDP